MPARPGLAGWGTRPHTASLAKQQQQQQVPCDARDALQSYARILKGDRSFAQTLNDVGSVPAHLLAWIFQLEDLKD